ncbi:MAG: primosomal protein N' (replication factor Y) [Alphaproteobacteria bacterium]|jgi:primosomal protein N' (replication factor Y)
MDTTDATTAATTGPRADSRKRVSVLLPLPLAGAYDYGADRDLELQDGDFVAVPLGSRERIGVVWGDARGGVDDAKIKQVAARLDAPPLPETLRKFVDWVAAYSLSPPGAVLRMTMNVPSALEPPKPVRSYAAAIAPLDPPPDLRITPARKRVLDILAGGPPRTLPDLTREAGVGASVIKGLAAAGAIITQDLPPGPSFTPPDPDHPAVLLSAEQRDAAQSLSRQVDAQSFVVTLLDGVTGSGKTEVYFEAIASALRLGRQALVLLPEIALTPQWFDRFRRRFGTEPVVWHSDLGEARRRLAWRAVATGEARVVVGARSALFLPFDELGVVIVDEEHESAYKQAEGVSYHARDMAIVRAQLVGCPIVLASATPSLETRVNVARGRYGRLELPERFGLAKPPAVEALDMRESGLKADQFLAPALREALLKTLAAGEQSLLFLNRRGYAPLTLCRTCGHRFECPSCSAWLVEHRFRRQLQCHHCGYNAPVPKACPHCESTESLAVCGPGVERIAEEVRAVLPDARLGVMTSDTMRGPEAALELVRTIEAREIDILIGTQMVAKGHHFPHLTLVGIVDADLGLSGGDLRASERTYQVLHQVAGRAGRAERPGRVIVQTHQPEHPVMQAMISGDREAFMQLEEDNRAAGGWPPFGRLAALIVSSRDGPAADGVAAALARYAPSGPDIQVLGPAPAPLAMLRGQHRRRLLLKTARDQPVQPLLREWLSQVKVPARVRVRVDIDPYSFL